MPELALHGVSLSVYTTTQRPWAQLDISTYPDRSPRNDLDAEDLRDLAEMLINGAELLEDDS